MLLRHFSLTAHEEHLVEMSSEEYREYMTTAYPELFGNIDKPMTETCMCWGFEIPCGWRHVLDGLCARLQAIYEASGVLCLFDQIKEKFGGARFYYTPMYGSHDKENVWLQIISDLVDFHEEYCSDIDEDTGLIRTKKERNHDII